ncbi:hypothetical protein JW826_02375 [Candidatus Woesearchaeota archaeon]|nr:hypothetical protein [Candidatus Woesearchaeota archaeon]
MRIFLAITLSILLLASLGGAYELSEYSAEYDIIGDKVLVKIDLSLSNTSGYFIWGLPGDAKQLEVKGFPYSVIDLGESKAIVTNETITSAELSYVTEALLEETSDSFFIADFSKIDAAKISILLKLPEEATLKYSLSSERMAVIPKTKDILTDGQRIIIHWDEQDFKNSKAVLVIFKRPGGSSLLLMIGLLAFALAAITAAGAWFYTNRMKAPKTLDEPAEKERTDLMRNLFDEEKKIIEVLLDAKDQELWQKQLELRTGLNKVKLSRKLRSLEAKGLVEKVPYGNTNHIRIKKRD